MKTILKFLLNPIVNLTLSIFSVYMMFHSEKYFITYCILAPFATVFIWAFHWKFYQMSINKVKENKDISNIIYPILFIVDVLTWPNALIHASSIILEEEKNV